MAVGLYGMITSRHYVRTVLCLSVVQSSTYVLLILGGFRTGGTAPIFSDVPTGTLAVDPVVQALCLTDVVVGAAVSALLLALTIDIHKRTGSADPDEVTPMRG